MTTKSAGFSLIELALSVAVLTIIAFLAMPNFTDLIRRYESESKGHELFELLILMRAKAYHEHKSYTLCPSDDGKNCGGSWTSGAILFSDYNENGKLDTNEAVERKLSRSQPGAILVWKAFNNKGFIIFHPDGTTPGQSGHFKYCPSSREEEYGWVIILNAIGRPYFGKDRDGDGIVEGWERNPPKL